MLARRFFHDVDPLAPLGGRAPTSANRGRSPLVLGVPLGRDPEGIFAPREEPRATTSQE